MVCQMVPDAVGQKPLPGPDGQDPRRYIVDNNLERHHYSRRTWIRTHRAEVHEGGECDGPEAPRVEHVTTMELEEPALGTQMSDHSVEQRTNQKAIG